MDWGRVGVAGGRTLHFTFSSSPGAGAGMPADRRPQPWQETRSPALARLPFLMGAEGEAGQDGWQAAPPGQRLLTDGRRRRSPRLNRKPAGAAAGPRGAPRAPLPRAPGSSRARRWPARPLPLARLLSRAPCPSRASPRAPPAPRAPGAPSRARLSSRAPLPRGLAGAAPRGGRRLRPGGGRPAATALPARIVKGGLRSKLGAAAGGPGREEAPGRPLERAESPAWPSIVPLFLCSRFSAHSPRSHPQTRSLREPESAPRTPQPGLAGRPGLMSVFADRRLRSRAGCLGAELFLQLFFAG